MGHSVGVLGASGYAGAELVRLCADHPGLELAAAAGDRRAGEAIEGSLPHVAVDGGFLDASEFLDRSYDVVFSCLPSGRLGDYLESLRCSVLVDLSDGYRAADGWSYGLPELHLPAGPRIANPGCYPTASLLALVPFARSGVIEGPVIVDAMSGFSGAGRKDEDHLLLASGVSDVTSYGTVEHRHVPEIERGLKDLGRLDVTVSFTPHLVPMARGLLVTARARLSADLTDAEAHEVLDDAYRTCPFVRVISGWPRTKATTGSNLALVSARVDTRNGFLIASAAIDNLGKGAAGQAIQNANLVLGLDETTGLSASGVWP